MTLGVWIFTITAGAALLSGQSPVANYPVVELDGKVSRVITFARPGEPPSLDVKTPDGNTARVVLGSFRFLMENDFNPKAGTLVKVVGFKAGEEIIAREVTLVAEKRTLQLRDRDGWPLWRFGRHRGSSQSR